MSQWDLTVEACVPHMLKRSCISHHANVCKGQAQYIRIPYADFNALKLPPGKEFESDFILLAGECILHEDIYTSGHITNASRHFPYWCVKLLCRRRSLIILTRGRVARRRDLGFPARGEHRSLWSRPSRAHGGILCYSPRRLQGLRR